MKTEPMKCAGMKYVVILGDGMADYPLVELDNKTPLQFASTTYFDYFASHGQLGRVKTVPEGMNPGSDTANLAVLGYDPKVYYSGRSPFEAVSMGVILKETDVTFRCNLVTVSLEEDYGDRVMLDHSSDEITTEEARELIKAVNDHFKTEDISFFTGISYRHLLVWDKASFDYDLTPPHDIIGRQLKEYLPKGANCDIILHMMKKSAEFLMCHPINLDRIKRGLKPANTIWIWGEGKKPLLSSFSDKYGLKGSVISAVDLIKGIGLCAGLQVVEVEGATGNLHTNYEGKARAALEELKNDADFVYLHVEAPDECGHRYEIKNKVKAIERIDNKIAKIIKEGLDDMKIPYKIMVLPDHPTPLCLRTHTSEPVPFAIYDSTLDIDHPGTTYNEECAMKSVFYIEEGYKLMDYFIKGTL